MRRILLVFLASIAALAVPRLAGAGDLDLDDDDDDKPSQKGDAGASTYGEYAPPVATIKPHAYTLEECLALADRNHPNLWAARARLALVRGQLDEAKWTPFWGWYGSAQAGVLPPIGGTAFYNAAPSSLLNTNLQDGWGPFFRFDINGAVPLWTFGKIDAVKRAGEAQVRVFEWDQEKFRQQTRMDVRRAYFGLLLARDAKYLADDIMGRVDKVINSIKKKLAKGDTSLEEIDKIRMQIYRDEIHARVGEAVRGESYALAVLRFVTGVQTAFDVPDEPLKRPDTAIGPIVRYLQAARLFRPEVNMARAGVSARGAWVDYQRARLFPDIGLGLGASYSYGPTATIQNNAWVVDPFNRFGFAALVGMRWPLDLMPQAARTSQAEAQLEESRALERLALGGVSVEVEGAYAAVLEAKTREESWDRAEHRARQWISTVQDAIDIGTKDERAMNEPLRVYVGTRVAHLYALMDLNINMSELARVSGWDTAAPTGR